MNFSNKKELISIIIPAYNESLRISKTLNKILSFIEDNNDYDFEIIVVNDGSNDNTNEVVLSFANVVLIDNKVNKGKGSVIRQGMLSAQGDYLLFSDADLSTPIEELEKLLSFIKDFDIVIGSRALQNDLIKEHQPFYREIMGKTFNLFVQLLVVKGIKDTQCGFKLFKNEVAKKIFGSSKIDGFSFDVETIYLASKFRFKVKEVPVLWFNDDRSKVDPIKDSMKMFRELLVIKNLHKNQNFIN